MITTLFAVLLATTPASPSIDPGATGTNSRPQVEPIGAVAARLNTALQAGDNETALSIAKGIAAHADFDSQPLRVRIGTWYVIGLLNTELKRYDAAVEALRIVTRMPGAEADMWFALIDAQNMGGRRDDAALTVIEMIRALPSTAESVNDTYIFQLASDEDVAADTRFALREALWDADWEPEEASHFWLDYIDGLLTRDGLDRAVEVLPKITSPSSRVQLHASRRYEALLAQAGSPPFDIAAVFAADLAADRAAVAAIDADFDDRSDLATSLLMGGLYEEAVAVADVALALPRPAKDTEEWSTVTWIMDVRSRALMAMGRHDEALAQMQAARQRVEGEGSINVSQTINLAWLYLRLGRNAEALAVVGEVGEDTVSPFGWMQALQITACAAHGANETAVAGKAFTYLSEHWRDEPNAAYDALACRGDTDGMAALLILRLEDSELSESALAGLHTFLPTANPTAFDARLIALHQQVMARPDVVAARDRVGRVLTVPTLSTQF